MIEKVDQTFYEITGQRLQNVSQLKLFSILRDTHLDEYFLSVFNSYNINQDLAEKIFYDLYEVGHNEWWDDISYKYYGTPYLWWSVALMNDVVNPFEELEVGSSIFVLRPSYLYQFLKEIKNVGLGG